MNNRYVHMFEYEGAWMIVLYKDGKEYKYFNDSEHYLDDSMEYLDMFLENGGNLYRYSFDNYELVQDIDIFNLGDKPIEELEKYLVK